MTIQAVSHESQQDAAASLAITVEFTSVSLALLFEIQTTDRTTHSGGLEMLFSNERKHKITIPGKDEGGTASNIAYLIRYLCQNLMKDSRKELFVLDDSV